VVPAGHTAGYRKSQKSNAKRQILLETRKNPVWVSSGFKGIMRSATSFWPVGTKGVGEMGMKEGVLQAGWKPTEGFPQ
jgi:hypothetical protein